MELILAPMVEDGQGSDRLDGRRHAARGDLRQAAACIATSSGRISARSPTRRSTRCANAGDEPEDALRQPRQHPRPRTQSQCRVLVLDSPVLTDGDCARACARYFGDSVGRDRLHLPTPAAGPNALRAAHRRIRAGGRATRCARAAHRVVPDRRDVSDRTRVADPDDPRGRRRPHPPGAPAACAPIASLNVRSAECLDTHYFAVLIGVGATDGQRLPGAGSRSPTAIARGLFGDLTLEQMPRSAIKKAIDDGLLKIMSKMGIAVISSYRGGYNFEAVGLSRALWSTISSPACPPISGIGSRRHPARRCWQQHAGARPEDVVALPIGGFYRQRHERRDACLGGAADPPAAERGGDRQLFDLSAVLARRARAAADLAARPARLQLRREAVADRRGRERSPKSASASSRRACRSARSSPEAHETLTIAMNRIGAKAVSGEGGEDPARYKPAAERRQRQLGDQADRLGPLRRHRRISQPVPTRSRSRSPRAPSPARAASCPASRSPS